MRRVGYSWHLRQIMSARGMHQTSDLVGPLAERGISLSREQVYRLVTQTPQRLNLDVMVALCDILDCGSQDLITSKVENQQVSKAVAGGPDPAAARALKPSKPTVIRKPGAKS